METIVSLLKSSCRTHAENTALRHKREGRWFDLSYRRLWEISDAIACGLLRQGLKTGEHVAILAPSSPAWVCSYLGILKTGAIVVPVDRELKTSEIRHILHHSDTRMLFTTEEALETVLPLKADLPLLKQIVLLPARGNLDAPARSHQALESLMEEWQGLLAELEVPEEKVARMESLMEQAYALLTRPDQSSGKPRKSRKLFPPFLKLKRTMPKTGDLIRLRELQREEDFERPCIHPDSPALILYTSGTTGRPKGAMLLHRNVTSNIRAASRAYGLDETIHTLSFLPINHVFEQVMGILVPLSLGGKISFAESIKKLPENLAEVRPSFLLAVPALYRRIHDRIHKGISDKPLANLLFSMPLTRQMVTRKVQQSLGAGTIFISGGAALDPQVAAGLKKLGINIYQGYGITETSPVIAAEWPGTTRLGSVGKPLEEIEIRIESPGAEGVGEILVKGPNVMRGYYKDEQATREALKDGWYHTGDLGRIDEEGYLHICGRVKNLIVTSNGKNVYPEEVEEALLGSPYVAEAMVYGHKEGTSEEVYAIIYPDPEALDRLAKERGLSSLIQSEVEKLIRDEINAACRNLADYKRIKRFSLREDEFPKTTTRKIKRYVVEPDIPA